MRSRVRDFLITGAALLAAVSFAAPDHQATIRILTHDPRDLAPQQVQAAVDLGLVGVSVLVTWSRRLTY